MAQQHTHTRTHTHLHTPGVQILKQSDQQTCQDQVHRILTLPQVRQLKVCRSVPRECPSMGMSSGRMGPGRGRMKGSVRRPGSPRHPEAMEELTPEGGRKKSQASGSSVPCARSQAPSHSLWVNL